MTETLDRELLTCFLDEALDELGRWEGCCLELERNGESTGVLNKLFRAAHNLKGASRAVGLTFFGEFVHTVEDIIQKLLRDEFPVWQGVIGILLDAQVVLINWIDGLRSADDFTPDFGTLPLRIEYLLGTNRFFEALKARGIDYEPIKSSASLETLFLRDENLTTEKKVALPAEDDLDALFAAAQQEFEATASAPVAPAAESGSKTKTHAEAPPTSPPPLSPAPSAEVSSAPPKEPSKQAAASSATAAQRAKVDETIRVGASKLDELIKIIGELTIHQTIVDQARRSNALNLKTCLNAIQLISKITRELHGKALALRMQPVQGLFQRIERVARDVARSQSKNIEVEVFGTEVELDKTVIERITDPLVHVTRNAVDHGIEVPALRTERGKRPAARIRLEAVQEPSGVKLIVSDDGNGLNSEKILQKARERNLVAPDQVLSTREIHNLIFLPNFSTADKVTDISGRGVGMDVVMRAVQELQGSIELRSVQGEGTTFEISLPTSLSVIDALIIRVGSIRYAVAMHDISEILDLKGCSIETTGNEGKIINLRGRVVPLTTIAAFLQDAEHDKELNEDRGPALIVNNLGASVALRVSEIIGQQQVVVRPLSEQLSHLNGFNGCTILGDGEPGMIISLPEIVRSFLTQTSGAEASL